MVYFFCYPIDVTESILNRKELNAAERITDKLEYEFKVNAAKKKEIIE